MNADMLSKIWWAHERFIVIGARPIYPLGLGYVDQLCNTGFEDLVLLNHTWSTLRHRCEISLTRDSRHRGGFEDLVLLDPTPALERAAVVHERFIVIVGWPIYPPGHFFGMSQDDECRHARQDLDGA